MSGQGVVVSLNISREKGQKKTPVDEVTFTPQGIEGDAHAGDWHRQVSLLAEESARKLASAAEGTGITVGPGDFAENITTRGLDLLAIPVGTRLRIGDEVVLEVTQHGKECHDGCEIKKQVGDCVMPREGIFGNVVQGGKVRVGNALRILTTEGA